MNAAATTTATTATTASRAAANTPAPAMSSTEHNITALCPHARRVGACSQVCTAPAGPCLMWGLGAAPVANSTARARARRRALQASVLHLAVAAAAFGALVLIVKTAAGA